MKDLIEILYDSLCEDNMMESLSAEYKGKREKDFILFSEAYYDIIKL